MSTFTDDDYEEAANRSYELSIAKGHELRSAMSVAMNGGEVNYTGAAREDMFFSEWTLVESIIKELAGKTMVRLVINASRETRPQYAQQQGDTWRRSGKRKGRRGR